MPLAVNWNSKSAIKFEKKQSAKTRPKNKQISITTNPKTTNPQTLNKTLNSREKQAQFRGKTARLATLLETVAVVYEISCVIKRLFGVRRETKF